MPKTQPAYPEEFRREAVQLLRAGRTPRELAESLGVSEQTLRNWRRQDQVDRHERDDGLTSDGRDELRRLRRENARLKQERTCSNEPRLSSRQCHADRVLGGLGRFFTGPAALVVVCFLVRPLVGHALRQRPSVT